MRLIALLLALTMGTKVSAFTDFSSALRAFNAVDFSTTYANLERRTEMALAAHDYWFDFENRLPRLSPRELDWLTSELDTKDSDRINRLSQTREYHLWELGNLADQCTVATKGLVDAINSLQESEMFHWTKLASCYHQSDGQMMQNLKGAGIFKASDKIEGYGLDGLILTHILNVITPSAMADTMGWTLNRD